MQFNELLSKVDINTFNEIITLAPRKVRESLYSHYGIKNKKLGLINPLKEKKDSKLKKLKEKLNEATHPKEIEFIKELIRNWLYHRRPLLKSTLDFLEIENDNGLVEIETNFFQELDEETIEKLISHLRANFSDDEIMLYLYFVEVPGLDKYFIGSLKQ